MSSLPLRSIVKTSAKVTGLATSIGIGYGYYLYETDEGTCRAIQAYGTFVPVVLNYRLVEAKRKYFPSTTDNDSDSIWNYKYLDQIYAKKTVAKLGELQVCFFKKVLLTHKIDNIIVHYTECRIQQRECNCTRLMIMHVLY